MNYFENGKKNGTEQSRRPTFCVPNKSTFAWSILPKIRQKKIVPKFFCSNKKSSSLRHKLSLLYSLFNMIWLPFFTFFRVVFSLLFFVLFILSFYPLVNAKEILNLCYAAKSRNRKIYILFGTFWLKVFDAKDVDTDARPR